MNNHNGPGEFPVRRKSNQHYRGLAGEISAGYIAYRPGYPCPEPDRPEIPA